MFHILEINWKYNNIEFLLIITMLTIILPTAQCPYSQINSLRDLCSTWYDKLFPVTEPQWLTGTKHREPIQNSPSSGEPLLTHWSTLSVSTLSRRALVFVNIKTEFNR